MTVAQMADEIGIEPRRVFGHLKVLRQEERIHGYRSQWANQRRNGGTPADDQLLALTELSAQAPGVEDRPQPRRRSRANAGETANNNGVVKARAEAMTANGARSMGG